MPSNTDTYAEFVDCQMGPGPIHGTLVGNVNEAFESESGIEHVPRQIIACDDYRRAAIANLPIEIVEETRFLQQRCHTLLRIGSTTCNIVAPA